MATIHWNCPDCKRPNERRGIPDNRESVMLRCPGCHKWYTVILNWFGHMMYTCQTRSLKRVK